MSVVLTLDDVSVHYRRRRGLSKKSDSIVHAVDGVSFDVQAGRTLALVGESGSGKTTVARAVLQLTEITSGSVSICAMNLADLKRHERMEVRRKAQIVFQDPYSSLDPRMTVHDLVAEPLRTHGSLRGTQLRDRVTSLLEMVGLGTQHLWRRPHEFSGGQCQRIAIARALALEPALLVLDEPTSALDVSVQARILVLLQEIQQRLDVAYLFIAHDLAVVRCVAHTVAVMYLGEIVEMGPAQTLFESPRHPYTAALMSSVPSPDPRERSRLKVLEGDMPSVENPPPGCRFHTRCRYRMPICEKEAPPHRVLESGYFRCHLESGAPEIDDRGEVA